MKSSPVKSTLRFSQFTSFLRKAASRLDAAGIPYEYLDGSTLHRADVIARCNYDVDIHDPQGTKAQIIRLKQPYEIPFRCLLPRGVDNLLVAGRPISADHVANSSLRIQPNCYALGQAAGTAAALAASLGIGIGPWELGGDGRGGSRLRDLQKTLLAQGADLGPDCARKLDMLGPWRQWQLQFALQAYPVPKGFTDIPEGHPAHEAAMSLARMGVFRGLSETEFGASGVVSCAVAATVISRALATLPSEAPTPTPAPAQLPEPLAGEWWSSALADCAGRGIIPAAALAALVPDDPIPGATLQDWLTRAFPGAPSAILTDPVTRADLAAALWTQIQSTTQPPTPSHQ